MKSECGFMRRGARMSRPPEGGEGSRGVRELCWIELKKMKRGALNRGRGLMETCPMFFVVE